MCIAWCFVVVLQIVSFIGCIVYSVVCSAVFFIMPPFKVWDSSRQLKKVVMASTLSELIAKGLFVHKICTLNLGYMWLVTIKM